MRTASALVSAGSPEAMRQEPSAARQEPQARARRGRLAHRPRARAQDDRRARLHRRRRRRRHGRVERNACGTLRSRRHRCRHAAHGWHRAGDADQEGRGAARDAGDDRVVQGSRRRSPSRARRGRRLLSHERQPSTTRRCCARSRTSSAGIRENRHRQRRDARRRGASARDHDGAGIHHRVGRARWRRGGSSVPCGKPGRDSDGLAHARHGWRGGDAPHHAVIPLRDSRRDGGCAAQHEQGVLRSGCGRARCGEHADALR